MLAVHNRLGGSITTTTASTSSATEPIPAPRHHLVHSPTPSPTPPFVLPRARVAGEELKRECGHVRKLEGMKGTTQLDIAVRFGKKFGKMGGGGGGGGQRSSSGSAKRRKTDGSAVHCSTCQLALSRPLLCLGCGAIACTGREGKHAAEHTKSSGHHLFFDLRSAAIFCFECSDYVPLPEESQTRVVSRLSQADPLAPSASLARRGFKNLGQTCYMSVVVQSLLHNPLLRTFFLADKHNRTLCKVNKPCLCCEIDLIFTESCKIDGPPFGPTSFLYTMWKSSELSGYAQQDVQEFFITVVNLLHSSLPDHKDTNCPCIIHRAFGGKFRSELTCGKCAHVTRSHDDFLDLSLDLRPNRKGGFVPTGSTEGENNTLQACLKRFTSPEILSGNGYACAACGDSTHISKQLSIEKLPSTLNIQLKRFEHTSTSQKIDVRVQYPSTLDMRDFTSSTLDRSRKKGVLPHDDPGRKDVYDLFSVIVHEGKTTSDGHYYCYVKGEDDWYLFDDEKIKRVSLAEVLMPRAYLLGYSKRI